MESAAEVIARELPSFELAGLHEAINACRSASAHHLHSGQSDIGTLFIIKEDVDLNAIEQLCNSTREGLVPVIAYPIGPNEISDDLTAALEHEIDKHLPFPFSPLWRDLTGDESYTAGGARP